MKIGTVRTQQAIPDRLWEALRRYQPLWGGAAALLFGGMMAGAEVFGILHPFAAAFVGALPMRWGLPGLAGVVCGSFWLAAGTPVQMIAVCLLIYGVRWVLGAYDREGRILRTMWFSPVVVFLSSLLIGIYVIRAFGYAEGELVTVISESILSGASCYFLRQGFARAGREGGLRGLDTGRLACAIVAAGILLIALAGVTFGGFSIGRMLACLIVLAAAGVGRESLGSIAGLAAGLAMGILRTDSFYLLGAYGVGGLMAGIFGVFGRIGTAAAFILVNAMAALFTGMRLMPLYEVMAASVLYMLLPQRWLARIAPRREPMAGAADRTGEAAAGRLSFAAGALRDLSATVDEVARRMDRMRASGDPSVVFERAAETVCRRCALQSCCWGQDYNGTMDALGHLRGTLVEQGRVTPDDLPESFTARCRRPEELTGQINQEYHAFRAKEGACRRVGEMRSVGAEQFDALSILLDSLADEFAGAAPCDRRTAERIAQFLTARGMPPETVFCRVDDFSRMTVEITARAEGMAVSGPKLAVELGELCDRVFDQPAILRADGRLRILLAEKPTFDIGWGGAQHICAGNRLCGDSFESFLDGRGYAYILLSDGMGTGGRAAIDSAMTVQLMRQLIEAGFDCQSALRVVNAALLVKSGDESLATVDICRIDLFDGRVELLKAGAAPTFLRKGGRVGRAEAASLPAGILGGVSFERSRITLEVGDLVVMLSDGAVASGYEWIAAELGSWQGEDPQALAGHLVEEARRRRLDHHEDDITVAVGMLRRGM